jgi:hypothetical protein
VQKLLPEVPNHQFGDQDVRTVAVGHKHVTVDEVHQAVARRGGSNLLNAAGSWSDLGFKFNPGRELTADEVRAIIKVLLRPDAPRHEDRRLPVEIPNFMANYKNLLTTSRMEWLEFFWHK